MRRRVQGFDKTCNLRQLTEIKFRSEDIHFGRRIAVVKGPFLIMQSIAIVLLGFVPRLAMPQSSPTEYVLGAGDIVHITVFNNPELTTDVRVSETGSITFPLGGG